MPGGKGRRSAATTRTPAPRVEVLGVPVVEVGEARRPLSPRLRFLLVELAFARPAAVPVDALLAADRDLTRPALQTALWRLRTLLGAAAVLTDGDSYRLAAEVPVDLDAFEADVDRGWTAYDDGDLERCAQHLGGALQRWRSVPDPVVATRQGRDRRAGAGERRAAATERWAQASIRLGRPEAPRAALEALTAAEPLREGAWVALIEAQRAAGDEAAAATTAVHALAELGRLGVEPSPALARAAQLHDGTTAGRTARLPSWLAATTTRRSFVERSAELAELLDAVALADRGEARLTIVAGEAGVGKTRLLAELAQVAAGRGVAVWGGRWDRFGASPFRGLVEALEAVVFDAPADALRAPGRDSLWTLLHGGAAQADAAPAGPDRADHVAGDQLALFDAAATLLERATTTRPGLVLLDDLQWADWKALLLVRHVLRTRPTARLCLVASYRTSEPAASGHRELLDELIREPGVAWKELPGLTSGGVATMPELAEVAQRRGDDLRDLARWTVRVTGGNALFIDRLLEAPDFLAELRRNGTGDAGALSPPARLAAVLRAHVAHLDPAVRRVLGLAALLGPDVDTELLARVAARPPDAGTPDVAAAIAQARAAGLLIGEGRRLHFAHDLLAQELAAALPEAQRWRAHLRLADELSEGGSAATSADPFALAHHLAAAGDLAPPQRVHAAACAAGRAASRRFDFGLAARWFTTAARHAEPDDVVASLLQAAEMAFLDGATADATRLLDEAEGVARRASRPADLGRVALARSGVERRQQGRTGARSAGLAREVLDRGGAGLDGSLEAELRFLVALADARPGAVAAMVATVDEPALRVDFAKRGIELGHLDGEAALERILAGSGTADGTALGLLWRWFHDVQDGTGRFDDPLRREAVEAAVAVEGADPWTRWAARAWEATRLIALARFTEAQAAAARAFRTGRTSADVRWSMQALNTLRLHQAGISFPTGRPEAFAENLVALDPAWNRDAHAAWQWEAFRLAWEGHREEALSLQALACDQVLARPGFGHGWLMQLASLASSAYALGDVASAEKLLAALAPFSGRHALRFDSYLGPVDHEAGLLRGVLGDLDGAIEALRDAVGDAASVGGTTFELLGGMQLVLHLRRRARRADRAEADAVGTEVLGRASALGMERVALLLGS